jgi:hypothetical protein
MEFPGQLLGAGAGHELRLPAPGDRHTPWPDVPMSAAVGDLRADALVTGALRARESEHFQ